MQDYDIKRGYHRQVQERGLSNIVSDIFGSAEVEGEYVTTTYGALKELKVRVKSPKVLEVDTTMTTEVDDDTAATTIRLYSKFLQEATGFTAKERKKRMS